MASNEKSGEGSGKSISDQDVREAALDWFTRIRNSQLHPQDRTTFQEWLAADPRHGKAYKKVSELWASDVFAHAIETANTPKRSKWPLTARASLAAAVTCLALLIGIVGFGNGLLAEYHALFADYATGVGERRTIALNDGSRITLNTASAIDVEATNEGHRIWLRRGEAYFEVRPQTANRSFNVIADETEVSVIGTAFHVREDLPETVIGVSEGNVAVHVPVSDVPLVVRAGRQLRVDAQGNGKTDKLADRSLAWLEERIEFHERPLGEVVDELRRYHPGLILIANERLETVPVSGSFRIDAPEIVLASIAVAVSADLFRLTDRVLILR